MRPEDVRRLYDDNYASTYEERFLTSPMTAADSAHELQLLRSLLVPTLRWLDVACGTGFFLRHFPAVARAGIDLSPAMLRAARQGNPGVELREHDFRVPIPGWTDTFDVVSCMWYAYCLVDTVADLCLLVDNLADWTSPAGTCFVPLADPVLITGLPLSYHRPDGGFAGNVKVTGILWSYSEDDGTKNHTHLVAPHVDFMAELFQRRFDTVDIVRYPPAFPGWAGRPAVIAKGKRTTSASTSQTHPST